MTSVHLGCGQKYLNGYVNIDLPLKDHSVQKTHVVDIYQDIQTLSFREDSIEEIRIHHVFEHFTRPVACALIVSWRSWLKIRGIIRIEVPDLIRTAKVILRCYSTEKEKAVAIRHLFGSHEGKWAVHCEGYSAKILSRLLKNYGFHVNKINKNKWFGTYNIEITAVKTEEKISTVENLEITKEYLQSYLVNPTEKELLRRWLNIYTQQVEKTYAR